MIKGKSAQHNWFWTGDGKGLGGVAGLMTEKWIDKIID